MGFFDLEGGDFLGRASGKDEQEGGHRQGSAGCEGGKKDHTTRKPFPGFRAGFLLEPCVDFILECDDVGLVELLGTVDGKAQIGFPSLSRPHGDPQILRYLFPGAKDLSFFRFILPSRRHDKRKRCSNMRR